MSTANNRIKFYRNSDFNLQDSIKFIKEVNVEKDDVVINEILEWYNICNVIKEHSPSVYKENKTTVDNMRQRINGFFLNMDDDTVAAEYQKVNYIYIEDFWKLFGQFLESGHYSEKALQNVINRSNSSLRYVLRLKNVVKKFDSLLANQIRTNTNSAEILIDHFLSRKEETSPVIYLPASLKSAEFDEIFRNYLESEDANLGYIGLLASSQSSKECPISDATRLYARKKNIVMWKERAGHGTGYLFGVGISLQNNPDIVTVEKDKNDYIYIYDIEWLSNNLDYPTILNNFIYLFSFVDPLYRSCFPAIKSEMGSIERLIGRKGKKEYERGTMFIIKDMKSSLEMMQYSKFLSSKGIAIENVIKWFFCQYLKNEFGVEGFIVNLALENSSFIEKCRSISSEMDSVLKQFSMYVETREINRELFEISSSQIIINNIPSRIINKYAYCNDSDIEKESFLLFSDQSMLCYVSKYEEGVKNFCDLLRKNDDVKISDYQDWAVPDIRFLNKKGSIIITEKDRIIMNPKRIQILYDLYSHDVLRSSRYKTNSIFATMIKKGELKYESKLFSKPESCYLNYMLNRKEFSNGEDLRNKYIHGTYPLDVKKQETDYISLLKIMMLIVLKINEEFCFSL